MNHEPECTQKKQTTWALDGCQVCEAIRAAYKRGLQEILAPVRELADKFEQEGIHDSDAALRYRLAAARIYGAIGAAARGGEQG